METPPCRPRRSGCRFPAATLKLLWHCAVALGPCVPAALAHPGHYAAVSPASPLRGSGSPAVAADPAPTPAARLSVTIVDAKTGAPAAVRVRITDESGRPLGAPPGTALGATTLAAGAAIRLAEPGTVLGLPAEAIGVLYGANDAAHGYAFQPDGSFYVRGGFDLPVPAGKFTVTVSKGNEYVRIRDSVSFETGSHVTRNYRLARWIDMPSKGWYSADDHIHLRRSPRENPLILDWIAAEDVHVGVLLQMGDFWTTYFSQYGFGRRGRHGTGEYLLMSGQEEPRTAELGHTISIGAEDFVRYRDDYFSYDRLFDRVHELGGVSGYAHQGMSFNGGRGMTLDVLSGKIDFLELAQFCVPEGPLALQHYYRFLDLGYKLTALAGSDFPWCGRGSRAGEEMVGAQIGNARFYTLAGRTFSFEGWFDAVKAGHTFVTTGPMVEFTVNDQPPGTALNVAPGAKLRIAARAYGHPTDVPLSRLQIVGHGNVLAEVRPTDGGQGSGALTVELELDAQHGIWLAARADAGSSQMAHTTPVYVTVNGDGFHNRATLAGRIAESRRYLQEIRELLRPATGAMPAAPTAPGPAMYAKSRARLEQRIADAERKLKELESRR